MIVRPLQSHFIASAILGIVSNCLCPAPAWADELRFRAKKAEIDPELNQIVLEREIHLQYNRYHLRSQYLRLRKRNDGIIELEGESILSFCPCEQAPIGIGFSGAKLFPEGDLTLRFPRLLVFDVPVFALPWLWIRSPMQVGLFAPQAAWRGSNGPWLGSGLRLPWQGDDGRARVLEVHTAAYLQGGAELGLRFSAPASENRIAWDFYRNASSQRVIADARGFIESGSGAASIVWDVDAIRGPRERTPDFDAALKPYDRIQLDSILWTSSKGVLLTGLDARAQRGDGPVFWGPRALLQLGGDLAQRGTWDGLLEARMGALDSSGSAISMLRTGLDTEFWLNPGPFRAEFGAGARFWANTAAHEDEPAISSDASALLQSSLALPLARAFYEGPGLPWIHEIQPRLEGRFLAIEREGTPLSVAGNSIALNDSGAALLALGLETGLGRYGGANFRLSLKSGFWKELWGGENEERVERGLLLASVEAGGRWAAGWAELALAKAKSGQAQPGPMESALAAKVRMGRADGPHLRLETFAQSSEQAAAARFLSSASRASMLGEQAYLSHEGAGLGARMWIPWTPSLSTWVRGAAELSSRDGLDLLGFSGGLLGRHPCGCVALTLAGAYRKGREGADVSLFIDLSRASAEAR